PSGGRPGEFRSAERPGGGGGGRFGDRRAGFGRSLRRSLGAALPPDRGARVERRPGGRLVDRGQRPRLGGHLRARARTARPAVGGLAGGLPRRRGVPVGGAGPRGARAAPARHHGATPRGGQSRTWRDDRNAAGLDEPSAAVRRPLPGAGGTGSSFLTTLLGYALGRSAHGGVPWLTSQRDPANKNTRSVSTSNIPTGS